MYHCTVIPATEHHCAQQEVLSVLTPTPRPPIFQLQISQSVEADRSSSAADEIQAAGAESATAARRVSLLRLLPRPRRIRPWCRTRSLSFFLPLLQRHGKGSGSFETYIKVFNFSNGSSTCYCAEK